VFKFWLRTSSISKNLNICGNLILGLSLVGLFEKEAQPKLSFLLEFMFFKTPLHTNLNILIDKIIG
jgi:hypothetical protein